MGLMLRGFWLFTKVKMTMEDKHFNSGRLYIQDSATKDIPK